VIVHMLGVKVLAVKEVGANDFSLTFNACSLVPIYYLSY